LIEAAMRVEEVEVGCVGMALTGVPVPGLTGRLAGPWDPLTGITSVTHPPAVPNIPAPIRLAPVRQVTLNSVAMGEGVCIVEDRT
jgi:hypothetical protein